MVDYNNLGKGKMEWKDWMKDAAREIKESLVKIQSTSAKKDIQICGAIVVSVIAVSIILRDPRYSVVLTLICALGYGYWLHKVLE